MALLITRELTASSATPVSVAGENATGHSEKRSKGPLPSVARLLLFFGFIALVATGLHAMINHGLRAITTSNFGSFNEVMEGRVNADILVNGSSRALCHYDPRILQEITGRRAYNIGMNASQIDVQLGVLKAYLNHNSAPKILIQNLDLFSFETTQRGQIYDPGFFMPYLGDRDLYTCLDGIDPDVLKWKYIPLYGYTVPDMRFTWLLGLAGNFGWTPGQDYALGFNPRPGRWTEDFARFRAANPNGVSYRIEPKGVAAMEELLRLCQARNITVILVYSPEYREMQSLETNRSEIISRFRELSARFDVQFWDWSDGGISADQELFNNSQHLNARGAQAFSVEVARRIQTEFAATQQIGSGAN